MSTFKTIKLKPSYYVKIYFYLFIGGIIITILFPIYLFYAPPNPQSLSSAIEASIIFGIITLLSLTFYFKKKIYLMLGDKGIYWKRRFLNIKQENFIAYEDVQFIKACMPLGYITLKLKNGKGLRILVRELKLVEGMFSTPKYKPNIYPGDRVISPLKYEIEKRAGIADPKAKYYY